MFQILCVLLKGREFSFEKKLEKIFQVFVCFVTKLLKGREVKILRDILNLLNNCVKNLAASSSFCQKMHKKIIVKRYMETIKLFKGIIFQALVPYLPTSFLVVFSQMSYNGIESFLKRHLDT